MQKPFHEELTRTALDGVFGPRALDAIVAANLGQDALLNLLRGRYHFDANDFAGAHLYVAAQEEALLKHLEAGEAAAAWAAFGRLTHAVQDFYAHTNYAALWLAAHPEHAHGDPLDPLDPEILGSERLTAARVYYPLEALTIFKRLVPALQRILPDDSHANMNLDHPGRGPLFPAAMSAARARTRREFDGLAARIEDRLGPAARAIFQDLARKPDNFADAPPTPPTRSHP